MKTMSYVMLFLLTLCGSSARAQRNISSGVNQSDRDAIQTQVTSLIGSMYLVSDVVNVDSAAGNRSVVNGAITNPYNTLNGCYIFTAREESQDNVSVGHGVIGVFRNGSIVWNSGPVINNSLGVASVISGTRDLNHDGRVDIIVSWFEGAKGDIERLWVFSWDGQSGTMMNAVDDQSESVLISVASAIDYLDIDGNSVFEISGLWYDKENDLEMKRIIYYWNGTQYGKWGSPPQPLPSGFYPRDKVDAVISCEVEKSGDSFSYHYSVESRESSEQMINEFVLETPPDSVSNSIGPNKWVLGGVRGKALGWFALAGFDRFINPGKTESSYRFDAKRLPAIVRSLVRGQNGSWVEIFGDSVEYTLDEWYDEAKANSFKATTVGPSKPIGSFVPLDFLDTLGRFTSQSRLFGWIKDQPTSDKYIGYFSSAKTSLQQNNVGLTRITMQQVLHDVNVDSASTLTGEAYALIRYNTEYLLSQLPTAPPPGLTVKLTSSTGSNLTGGSLQYYDGSWKDATNNNDGTFSVTSGLKTLSLRMSYEFATQTKSNVTFGPETVIFQTVNTQVKLQNSQGVQMDTGSVQYYAGSWRSFGTTTSGIAPKELLPASYSFRMTYAGGSNDKQQDIGSNPVVVFQTVNASVQLKNSLGNLIDQGTVQYYAGSWRSFGITTNGVVTKELLPNNYSFRMTYASGSKDQQQNIGTNPVVVFQTVNATVQLKNSQGVLVDQGTVQYYAGAWRTFGTTSGGTVSKELLPNSYSFRMTNEGVSNDKTQDISANSTVSFSTVLCTVSVKNSQSQPVNNALISYYSSAWKQIGPTVNGQITKELLPANLTFRMTLGTATQNKAQNIATNSLVEFVTQ